MENLQRSFRLRQHQANDGAVSRIDNIQRHDADIGRIELAKNLEKAANAVFRENVELAHAGPIAGSSCRIANGRSFIAVTHVWDSLLANMQYTKIYRRRSNDKLNSGFEFADFRLRAPDLKKTLR